MFSKKTALLLRVTRNISTSPALCSAKTKPPVEVTKTKITSTAEKEIEKAENSVSSQKEVTEVESSTSLQKEVTKEDLQWRTPWHKKEGQYYTFLRAFYTEDNNAHTIKFLRTPINLSPSAIREWWKTRKENKSIALQAYIPERNQILGNELAAAHFIVYRGGAIKFYGEDKWIKADEYGDYSLPRHYNENKVLQAIDCSDMDLHYEGLANLRNLRQVEWLCINGCEHMDDWCMDRISNIFSNSLLYLDIRNCPKITSRGLGALYKMRTLKILLVDTMYITAEYEYTCLLLQELNPHLDIRTD